MLALLMRVGKIQIANPIYSLALRIRRYVDLQFPNISTSNTLGIYVIFLKHALNSTTLNTMSKRFLN